MSDLSDLLPAFISIPTVPFRMGTPVNELSGLARRYGGTRESYREESPQHTLTLPAFTIARVPVTNALYAAFVVATNTPAPTYWCGTQPPTPLRDHPVVDITWYEAQACCAWISEALGHIGRSAVRLPSEAEWEHAARGTAGVTFPWGEEGDAERANTRETGLGTTAPVASYPQGASPYGLLQTAGNIWEWTASVDGPYPYDPQAGREDVHATGRRILRGGCYANPQGYARCACRFRLLPNVRNAFIGFRLARSETL